MLPIKHQTNCRRTSSAKARSAQSRASPSGQVQETALLRVVSRQRAANHEAAYIHVDTDDEAARHPRDEQHASTSLARRPASRGCIRTSRPERRAAGAARVHLASEAPPPRMVLIPVASFVLVWDSQAGRASVYAKLYTRNSLRLNAIREALYAKRYTAKLYTRNAVRETLYAKRCTRNAIPLNSIRETLYTKLYTRNTIWLNYTAKFYMRNAVRETIDV